MNVTWTDRALQKIKERMPAYEGYFSLKYETEGCGCGVNGVTNLYYEKAPQTDETEWMTNAYPVYVNRHHEIYLEETLIIDYSEQLHSFQLKSPNQFVNPTMMVRFE